MTRGFRTCTEFKAGTGTPFV